MSGRPPIRWTAESTPELAAARAALARGVLRDHPDRFNLWQLAGAALLAAGDIAGAARHWCDGVARFPGSIEARVALAQAQFRAGAFEDALATLRADPRTREEAAGAVLELRLLMRLGDWEGARLCAPSVERLARFDQAMAAYDAHRFADDPAALLAACERLLAVRPGLANALHYRAEALDRLGRTQEARAVRGLERFVRIGSLELEGGDELHRRLRAEIEANDTLRADPRGKATQAGLQTERLVRPGNRALPVLIGALREAVEVYAAALEGEAHGFALGRPELATLEAWAVLYQDGGAQAPHRHNGAWLSGVFYVGGGSASGSGGALLLGLESEGQTPFARIEPVPGRLVLFPSATMHATEAAPPGSDRLAVAFDVIDAG